MRYWITIVIASCIIAPTYFQTRCWHGWVPVPSLQMMREAQELYHNDIKRQTFYFDQHTYLCSLLDRNDRTTMGAVIECREPFLDPRLVAGLAPCPHIGFLPAKKRKIHLEGGNVPLASYRNIETSQDWFECALGPIFSVKSVICICT